MLSRHHSSADLRNRGIGRGQGVFATLFVGVVLTLTSLACGPKDAGTISISTGDKNKAIEPDFGNVEAVAPVQEPDSGATPKSIKR